MNRINCSVSASTIFAALLLALAIFTSPAPALDAVLDPHAPGPHPSAQTFLDSEGRIDLKALVESGYDGPLDMKGLSTRLNPRTGELISSPRSSEQTRIAGDEYWAPGFGRPDPILGVDGGVGCLAVYDGELFVFGSFDQAGGVDSDDIARWDGTSWISMAGGMYAISCAEIYQGNLVVGGYSGIQQWDGTSWQGVGSGGLNGMVRALVVHDGVLYVGGAFDNVGGIMAPGIARWDGEVWAPMGPGFDAPVYSLAVYDGELIAGGEFTRSGITDVNHIARWDGLNWVPMGSGISGTVNALRQYGASLIAGGAFEEAGEDSVQGIARWNGSAWSALPGATSSGGVWIAALREYAGRLIVAGSFSDWNGQPANCIVQWDGASWWPMDSGMDGSVQALAIYDDQLHAGGSFAAASATEALGIARWNGITWSPLAEAPGAGLDGNVYALAAYQGHLVAGGWFYTAGTTPVSNIALWDGSSWMPLGDGLNSYVLALAVHGTDLYAGGGFNAAGGQEVNFVARWDGSAWHPLGSGMNTVVKALTILEDEVYAGGYFTRADGLLVEHIARWDGTQWNALGSGIDGVVNALCEFDGHLVAGGDFYSAGGTNARYIAWWDGSDWGAYGGELGHPVNCLAVHGDALVSGVSGGVYRYTGLGWEALEWLHYVYALTVHNEWLIAGGNFSVPSSSFGIARWNEGSSSWTGLGSGINYDLEVEALISLGDELIPGGTFTTTGGKSAMRLGRWTDPSIACRLTYLAPASSDTLMVGESVDIMWDQAGGCGSEVRIELLSGGYECRSIADQTENDGIFNWTVGSCYDEPRLHAIRIVDLSQGSYACSDSLLILPQACPVEGYWSGLFDPAGLDGAISALLQGPGPGQVIAGGDFTTGGGVPLNHVGIWDGANWSPMGSGLDGEVSALASWQGSVYAGGSFTENGSGGVVNHIARWDGAAWQPVGPGFDGPVIALAASDTWLNAGGYFLHAGGVPVDYIARWNGANWEAIDSGMDGPVLALTEGDLLGEHRLIAGGDFTQAGAAAASRVAQNRNGSWEPFGSGFDDRVMALTIVMAQWLVAGGEFTMSGADTVAGIGVWEYEQGHWEGIGDLNGAVHCFCWSNNFLVAGGSFDEAGGSAGNHVMAFSGQSWCPLGSGTNAMVRALAAAPVEADSSVIYAGGEFTQAGGRPSTFIGRWSYAAPDCPLAIVQPAGGETLEPESLVEIQWSHGDSCGTLARVELLNSGTPCAMLAAMTSNDGSHLWTVASCAGCPDDGYRIRVVDLDTGEYGESAEFTIAGSAGLAQEAVGSRPTSTVLFPCRPNPATKGVSLSFDLAQAAELRLEVFDVSGRCVALLAQGRHSPGRYRIQWSGRDQDDNPLPAGVYMCQMRAGGIVQTRKVLLTQ